MERIESTWALESSPRYGMLKPTDADANQLNWVSLHQDEYEVLRLVDFEEKSEDQVSRELGISASNVARILGRARWKVSQVLVRGIGLRIEGADICGNSLPAPEAP